MTTQVRKRRRTEPTPPFSLVQRRFTVAEYYRMAEAGILRPDERVELLEGAIITMSPMGARHAKAFRECDSWFTVRLVGVAIVSAQCPIHLDDASEPEPDIAILRLRDDRYGTSHAGPGDVLLLIEVADTSIGYDRNWKLPIYAAAGIPEVWIADLNGSRFLINRTPVDGRYTEVSIVGRGGSVTPLAFPDLTLPIDEILG